MTEHFRLSTAVMQRRAEPADSLDFFPTPPWATRAFCEHVLPQLWPTPDMYTGTACDPCCGEGHMALALADYFRFVQASDIHPYGFGAVRDFLHPGWHPPAPNGEGGGGFAPHWIVMNPPFNRAVEFVEKALGIARRGVAILVRTAFAEGQDRYARLFSHRPPQIDAQFVERVPMLKGRWAINGKSATAYGWMAWRAIPPHDWKHTRRLWIPPCRQQLTRHDDWLRFNGCMDMPEGHAVRTWLEIFRLEASGKPAELREAAALRARLDAAAAPAIEDTRQGVLV